MVDNRVMNCAAISLLLHTHLNFNKVFVNTVARHQPENSEMSGDGGFTRRPDVPYGHALPGAYSHRSQAAGSNHLRRGGISAAAAFSVLGRGQSGTVFNYSVSMGGTNQTRSVCVNTEAKDYRIGDIVEIPHLVLALDPNQTDDDYKVRTRVGEICPKWRPAVIVSLYQQRMTVLPIYTCNEKGMSRKPDHYKTTAMSIATPLMLNGPSSQYLTEEVLLVGDTWKCKEGQHVNLNEPVSINYAWPITKRSRLANESLTVLYKRYRTVHHMGMAEPVSEHEQYFRRKMQEDRATTRAQIPKPQPQVDADGFTLKTLKTRNSRV